MRKMSPQKAQQRIEAYHRGYQIHQHTFVGISDYSSENLFWSAIGWVFQSLAYIVVYPIVYLIVTAIKTFRHE